MDISLYSMNRDLLYFTSEVWEIYSHSAGSTPAPWFDENSFQYGFFVEFARLVQIYPWVTLITFE